MVVPRITVLCLALLFASLCVARVRLSNEIARREAAWAAALGEISPSRARSLRKTIQEAGALIKSEGAGVAVVSYEGGEENFVALSNLLLKENFTWRRWKCEKSARGIRGSLSLNAPPLLPQP